MLLAARLRGALIGRWHRTSRAQQQVQQLFPVAAEQQQQPTNTSRMASSNGASSAPSPSSAIDLIMLLHRLKVGRRPLRRGSHGVRARPSS
jgi:hypothetical protein